MDVSWPDLLPFTLERVTADCLIFPKDMTTLAQILSSPVLQHLQFSLSDRPVDHLPEDDMQPLFVALEGRVSTLQSLVLCMPFQGHSLGSQLLRVMFDAKVIPRFIELRKVQPYDFESLAVKLLSPVGPVVQISAEWPGPNAKFFMRTASGHKYALRDNGIPAAPVARSASSDAATSRAPSAARHRDLRTFRSPGLHVALSAAHVRTVPDGFNCVARTLWLCC